MFKASSQVNTDAHAYIGRACDMLPICASETLEHRHSPELASETGLAKQAVAEGLVNTEYIGPVVLNGVIVAADQIAPPRPRRVSRKLSMKTSAAAVLAVSAMSRQALDEMDVLQGEDKSPHTTDESGAGSDDTDRGQSEGSSDEESDDGDQTWAAEHGILSLPADPTLRSRICVRECIGVAAGYLSFDQVQC